MTQLEISLLISILFVVPALSGIASFLFWRKRSEKQKQRQFESKLREMLAEKNRHLSKLVESLLFESIELVKEEISHSDYQESVSQARDLVENMNKTISSLEDNGDSGAIAGMTVLQKKLQDMVDNLDNEIVARQEHEEVDYKTLN
jgi:hypothetical protein